MNLFKHRLKELRLSKKLTQLQLAETFNVSKMGVSHWEKGNSQPDYDTLIGIAKFFDVSTDYLLGITDESPL